MPPNRFVTLLRLSIVSFTLLFSSFAVSESQSAKNAEKELSKTMQELETAIQKQVKKQQSISEISVAAHKYVLKELSQDYRVVSVLEACGNRDKAKSLLPGYKLLTSKIEKYFSILGSAPTEHIKAYKELTVLKRGTIYFNVDALLSSNIIGRSEGISFLFDTAPEKKKNICEFANNAANDILKFR